MTDPAYQRLGLPVTASPQSVLRSAIRALHPSLRRMHPLRASRHRFYRAMLASHANLQAETTPVGAD